jgi:uncharacterized protein (TIGR02145 family)
MKSLSIISYLVLVVALILTSCRGGTSNEVSNYNEVSISNKASDSNKVNIGKQIWMSKNLNIDKFQNGDPIPEARTEDDWVKAVDRKQPAWCYFENDLKNGNRYGKLYNWYAVNDPRGIAPSGWHIPSMKEWNNLFNHIGAGNEDCLKSKFGWPNNLCSSNIREFSALPGGCRFHYQAREFAGFTGIEYSGYWWSSDEGEYVLIGEDQELGVMDPNGNGFSVRCLKD